MDFPKITRDTVKSLFETRFLKMFDLQYREGKHYYVVTRKNAEELTAVKGEEEFRAMLPDAVTCIVVLKLRGDEPRLLLSNEYRYPVGRFLLSPPAGLIDPEDREEAEPLIVTAKREILEETGISVKETDRIRVIDRVAFSTPGMTDESNGLVAAVIELENTDMLNQEGGVGSECFDGFELLTIDEAEAVLENGADDRGIYFSIYTWAALMYFTSRRWEKL